MPDERHQHARPPLATPRKPAGLSAFTWGCFALFLTGTYLILAPRLHLAHWQVTAEPNSQAVNTAFAEALRWMDGHVDLAHDYYEDAAKDGRTYNVVGLAFTLLSAVGTALTGAFGGPPDTLSSFWYVVLVALPLPIAAFAAFRTAARSTAWAGVLAGHLLIATCLAPVLVQCRAGSIYYINHVLAVTGLLIVGGDLLGPRRIWPALIGLALAAWSRQMTVLYALPILLLAIRRPPDCPIATSGASRDGEVAGNQEIDTTAVRAVTGTSLRPGAALWMATAGIAVIVAIPLALNWLKFGNPLDTGYARMFEGRTDRIGTRAQQALFSIEYLPMHLRAAFTDFPTPDVRKGQLYFDRADLAGGSMFLTSPILLGVFITLPRWWRDPTRRLLMLSTLPVMLGVMCYATTGSEDAGFYRYSLDFIPIWLLVAAPWLIEPAARRWTLACLAYSALYFYVLV